jgi:hypothetical protein
MDKKTSFATGVGHTVKVTFVAFDDGAYEMWQNGEQKSLLVFNKDKEKINGQPMKKKDYFLIEFTLDDQTTDGNLQVPANPMEAFWVCTPRQADPPSCPECASYDGEIFAVAADPDRGVLLIRNEDMTNYQFHFNMRFLPIGADPNVPSNYVAYDPIGQNDNGGVSFD